MARLCTRGVYYTVGRVGLCTHHLEAVCAIRRDSDYGVVVGGRLHILVLSVPSVLDGASNGPHNSQFIPVHES